MTLEQYINNLGLLMSDIQVDQKGRMFILVDGLEVCQHTCTSNCRKVGCNCKHGNCHDEDSGISIYKEIEIPDEYQTLDNLWNVKKILNK